MFGFRKKKSEDQGSDHGDENAPTESESNDNQDPQQEEDSEKKKGFFSRFKGMKKRDPLNPPPECFSRPLQLPQGQMPFPTFEVSCKGRLLDFGWAEEYPGDVLAAHDIQEPEWTRFLEDLAITASLKPRDRIVSHAIPMAMGVGLYGILICNAVKRIMRRGKANGVASVVDIWNACYFQVREVKVTLMHGDKALSGAEAEDEDSSDSSSDEDNDDENKKESQDQEEKKEGDEDDENNDRASPYYLVIEFQPIDPQNQTVVPLDNYTDDQS
ncbi:hypothetical protein BC943DRAFT_313690 [Umbelopsis sp. AD052]|nr:hypothetical protein BC943DRAFT_313690 [Umbelopsis sp. AD052]